MPGIGDAVHAGLDISRWSLLYYGSCVLLASFVLVNVLVGVVITSLDEARDMDEDKPPAEPPHTDPPADDHASLRRRIDEARRALNVLEQELGRCVPDPSAATDGPAMTAARGQVQV